MRKAAQRLHLVAILVDDYDRAIRWFADALGFHLMEDTDQGDGKRWVRMAADPWAETQILLAKAVTPEQDRALGNQAGGRVGFFLTVEDFDAAHARMLAAGVVFEEAPREEPYGTVAVFRDLFGNRWDLLGPAKSQD